MTPDRWWVTLIGIAAVALVLLYFFGRRSGDA